MPTQTPAERIPNRRKPWMLAATAAFLASAGLVQAGLVNEWKGDNYTSGNWVDDVGSVAMTANGTPLAVSSAFNAHTGVNVNGGFFTIPAGVATAGQSNFTVAMVFKPTGLGPFTPNYYNATPLAAFDIGGSGQTDWGLSWGGVSGQSVVAGVGTQNLLGQPNGDILQATTPVSLYGTHAVVFQVNASANTIVTYSDGVPIVTNTPVAIVPRSSANLIYVGGGQFVSATFPGQIAAIQIYNDATTNAVLLSQALLATYGSPAPVTMPLAWGADPGQNATFPISVPASAVASGPLTVTLTSDNLSVVATTNVTFPIHVTSSTATMAVLAVGTAHVTASGTGVSPAILTISGLDESGLVNEWLGDNYTNASTAWVDSIGGVVAAGTGVETAVPGAFGPGHQGVARNATGGTGGADGFTIPSSTAPSNLKTYTVVVAFKPTAANPGNPNYYNGQIMLGYDIGGAGQRDFGMSWGGSSGLQMVVGIGRSGGDSQISSPSGIPLALNATHVAALQVDSTAGTQKLFIDGLQVGQNTGLTMNAVNVQNIPLVTTAGANIGTAFAGLIGEVRIYTNAAINGAGLTAALQSKYAGAPLLAVTSAQPYADVGSNVTLNVTIPQSSSFNGSYTVTLTSDTPGVVASGSVTFGTGVTTKTANLSVVSAGTANITASGSGTTPATIQVGGLAPRTLIEAFRASSLPAQIGVSDGGSVPSWTGDTNSSGLAIANQVNNAAIPPTFHASATPSGAPSVVFTATNNSSLLLTGAGSPIGGLTNFSVAIVFKASAPDASTGGQWYNQTGIVDAEESGVHDDWGITMDNGGNLNFGIGNPDVTLQNPNYNLVNSSVFHVAVVAFDALNQQMRITVDDKPVAVSTLGTLLSNQPRDPNSIQPSGGDLFFGQGANNGLFWTGELVEADFYSGALTPKESTNVIGSLQTNYGVLFADKAAVQLTSTRPSEDIGSNITCLVTIPQGVNAGQTVTVNITSSNPGAVQVAGGPSANLIFTAGSTNVQTFSANIVGAGASTITAGSAGLLPASIVLKGVPAPVLIEAFRASSLTNQIPGIANGNDVTSWAGDTNTSGLVVASPNTVAPTFHTAATPSGSPSVSFAGANSLVLPGAGSPVGGLFDFSVALVFKVTAPATSSGPQWWSQAGILDAEEPNAHADWGITTDTNGLLNFGVGDPDTTLTLTNDNMVTASYYHVAVMVFDEIHQQMQITLDDRPAVSTPPFQGLSTLPRDPSSLQNSGGDIHFGQGADDGVFWSGEIVEADFYSGAVKNPAAIISALKTAYGIVFQPQPVNLLVKPSPGQITLTWASGKLLQAPSLSGPWTTNLSAVSPFTTSTSGSQQYYRVQVSP